MVFSGDLNKMRNILRNRLALSTVVTTLIILVVSVLLAGVVTYFAINITSTRVQEESLSLTSQHIWVAGSGDAVGAIMITNTGGRDVVINKITVRGQECAWLTQVYSAVLTGDAVTTDIAYAATPDTPYAADTTGPLVLPAGSTVGVMITAPDSVTLNDIGLTVAFTVFTSQAMYYKETNVQAAPAA
jgi:heme/copper-type cytochrome/quinol oxidase subunit 2